MEPSRKPRTRAKWVRNLKPGLLALEYMDLSSTLLGWGRAWSTLEGREKKGVEAGTQTPESDMYVKVMRGD